MDPLAGLSRHAERLRKQIHDESDPTLRKEMVKTHKSLMKEIRKASHQTSPAKLFLLLTVCLVVIIGGAVYGVAMLQAAYGIKGTVTSVILVIGAMIVLTAMAFLVMKVITPEMYKDLVQIGTNVLRTVLPGGSLAKSNGLDSISASAPESHRNPSALPAPTISFQEEKEDAAHSKNDLY